METERMQNCGVIRGKKAGRKTRECLTEGRRWGEGGGTKKNVIPI